MTYVQALVLGLVQGLTEFLPVSSSGHLALGRALFGLRTGDLHFEIVVHVATLFAVVAYYRRDLGQLGRGLFAADENRVEVGGMSPRQWLWTLVVATLPAVVVGLGFKTAIEGTFGDLAGVALRLLATGALLLSTASLKGSRLKIGTGLALAIGCAQAVAILPGISRSGATIAIALWLGIERTQAARFSFLLSIPAIAGAFVLQLTDVFRAETALAGIDWLPLLIGFVVAAASGYVAVAIILRALSRHWFPRFGIWCGMVGIIALWRWA